MLDGKRIILGISGGIAAYKAAILVRLLVKAGAEVRVVMTPFAKNFITPLTLSTLSKNSVLSEFYKADSGDWNSHVDLGLWADAFVIAPATANTMAKAAHAVADNLLITTYLSARCPVFFAPAMDLDMFRHPAVCHNIELLKSRGNHIIDAETGELASGLDGKGRMAEPETIVQTLSEFFNPKQTLNAKVLLTAGPTYEAIDPVRFIGNRSSGKMGYAIAEALAECGADVTIVSGPVSVSVKNQKIKVIRVESAQEMFEASAKIFPNCDIAVFTAAVADYSPQFPANQKIKKSEQSLNLVLKKNPDIAAELGKLKSDTQISVGFALETENEIENAKSKISSKNFDFIVLNSLNDAGAGFGTDTNKVKIIDKHNTILDIELKSKQELAQDIADVLCEHFNRQK